MKTTQMRRVSSLFITSIMMAAVGLSLFIGLLNRQRDLIILCILVFSIVTALKLWSKLAKTRIEWSLAMDRNRIFPGEKITFAVNVENHKPLPVWLEVEASIEGPPNAFVETIPFRGQQSLLWYQGTRFQWELTTLRRGINEMGPLRVISADLLGFFQEESVTSETFQFVVYPRVMRLAPFNLPKRDFFGVPGGESPVNDPVYILGTSDYHHGRPSKYIHWKASARHQRLQEKVFDSSEQEKVLFLIDVGGFAKANAEEQFERGIEVIASLAVQFDRRGCAIGLLTNGIVRGSQPSVAISRGSGQLSIVLETLARLDITCREEFTDTIQSIGIAPWGITCLYLTLTDNKGTNALPELMKRWKAPVVILTGEAISSLMGGNPAGSEVFAPTNEQVSVKKVQGL